MNLKTFEPFVKTIIKTSCLKRGTVTNLLVFLLINDLNLASDVYLKQIQQVVSDFCNRFFIILFFFV